MFDVRRSFEHAIMLVLSSQKADLHKKASRYKTVKPMTWEVKTVRNGCFTTD